MEGNMSPHAQIQPVNGDFHDETLRCCAAGKPSGPNLKVPASGYFREILMFVHKQISEPPRAAAVRHSATHKPHLVAPSHVWRGNKRR